MDGRSCSCRISRANARRCGIPSCAAPSSASTVEPGGPDFALAVLEGVALSARMLCEACDAAAGGAPSRLFLAGGGARSDLWAQIRADCLGRPLDRVAHLDVGCLGAAILAAVGIGAHALARRRHGGDDPSRADLRA